MVSIEGKPPADTKTTFRLGRKPLVVQGAAWSEWCAFGREQVETCLQFYPNVALKRYPFLVAVRLDQLLLPVGTDEQAAR